MEIRDLGPLRVETDGIAVPLNGRRLESVLAVLAANVDQVVTFDALVDAVWGAAAPERAAQSLESLIWRLRKILEPGRAARETATVLRTEEAGYRLALPRENVDSHRLLRANQLVAELLSTDDVGQALETADAALSLWRGQPCLGVPDAAWMAPVRAHLEEAHLELRQHRVQALLATAQPERALDDLAGLLAQHPYRERLWGQRMLALYRCGRQSEALQAYADARRVLADELGIDPGAELRELQRQILDQDRGLELAASAALIAGETHLPSRRAALIGREVELSQLVAMLAEHPLVSLTGTGGCGKTRLAIEAAYCARTRFGDGVWFVDLADVSDPALVWSRVALTLGLALQPGTDIEAMTLAFLAPRTMLLVLDNCEQVLDAVADVADRILESAPSVTLLTTTREPLELAGEQVYPLSPLDPPSSSGGGALTDSPAVQLFMKLVGAALPDLDLAGPDGASIARICLAVGGLPLGLELAASRARNFELAEVATALEHNPTTLTRPGRGSLRQSTLHDTIEWSHRLARADEQVLHRRLATINGPFTVQAAEGLCALAPLRPGQAMDLVAGLVHRSLLTPGRTTHAGGPSTFTQLVPIRAHAEASLAGSGERAEVGAARDRWVLDHFSRAPDDGRDGQSAWYDWIEDNYAAIDGTLTATLLESRSPTGLALIDTLTVYWYDRNRMVDGMRWLEAAIRLPDPDPFDRVRAYASYASARALNQETELAAPVIAEAIAGLSAASGGQAPLAGRLLVSLSAAAWAGDLWAESAIAATEARRIGESTGDHHVVLRARAVLAACEVITGDADRAVVDAAGVLEDNQEVGNHVAAHFACITNAIAAVWARDPEAGLHWSAQAMRHQRALGIRNVGDTLEQRGHHYATAGKLDAALRCYGAASAQHEREGRAWPRLPITPEVLDRLRTVMSPAEYERNWASGRRLGSSAHQYLPEEWG